MCKSLKRTIMHSIIMQLILHGVTQKMYDLRSPPAGVGSSRDVRGWGVRGFSRDRRTESE